MGGILPKIVVNLPESSGPKKDVLSATETLNFLTTRRNLLKWRYPRTVDLKDSVGASGELLGDIDTELRRIHDDNIQFSGVKTLRLPSDPWDEIPNFAETNRTVYVIKPQGEGPGVVANRVSILLRALPDLESLTITTTGTKKVTHPQTVAAILAFCPHLDKAEFAMGDIAPTDTELLDEGARGLSRLLGESAGNVREKQADFESVVKTFLAFEPPAPGPQPGGSNFGKTVGLSLGSAALTSAALYGWEAHNSPWGWEERYKHPFDFTFPLAGLAIGGAAAAPFLVNYIFSRSAVRGRSSEKLTTLKINGNTTEEWLKRSGIDGIEESIQGLRTLQAAAATQKPPQSPALSRKTQNQVKAAKKKAERKTRSQSPGRGRK